MRYVEGMSAQVHSIHNLIQIARTLGSAFLTFLCVRLTCHSAGLLVSVSVNGRETILKHSKNKNTAATTPARLERGGEMVMFEMLK